MPVTLKTGVMKYRKSDGTYSVMDALMPEQTQDQIAAIETAGQEQVNAIEQKGHDILDNLPEDYTELDADVGELKSAIADMNTATSEAIDKALSPKTVTNGKVTEWQFKTIPSGGGGGSGAVDDVQVNGMSVVQNGVANVPIANSNTFGTVKVDATLGISLPTGGAYSGRLLINKATSDNIKDAVNNYKPIVSSNQHESVFYGIAKAAGADMKNATGETIGVYPEAQKSAIQTMLGISGIIAPVEGATASNAYAIGDAFLHGGALYKASAAIAAGDAIVPGTNCTQTTIVEMLKGA